MQRTLSDEVQITDSHPQPPSTSCSAFGGILLTYLLTGLTNLPILTALSVLKIKPNLIV